MPAAIGLREDFTSQQVRRLAARVKDARQSRRLLSIAAIYDGKGRAEAAQAGGMDRQTLRDWVIRFNDHGPQGLLDRTSPGRPPRLSTGQKAELCEIVETGPDPAIDGIVRWRRVDLQRVIEARFGVTYHERSVSRLIHQLGFSHISARPQHPAQDGEMLETFKKTSAARLSPA